MKIQLHVPCDKTISSWDKFPWGGGGGGYFHIRPYGMCLDLESLFSAKIQESG